MANPTVDWERVGARFYRKIKLYDAVFDPDLELENYIIAGAPFAGALGELRELYEKWANSRGSTLSRRREAQLLQRVEGRQAQH